jgi:hypothetical protein
MVTLLCCKFFYSFLYFVKKNPSLTNKIVPRPFFSGTTMILYNFVNMKYIVPFFGLYAIIVIL